MAWITIFLLGFHLGFCSQFPLRMYYFVDKKVTWYEAQQYCREHYGDLATFESIDDIKRLEANLSFSWAWIGLWDNPKTWKYQLGNESNSWRWSGTGETSKTGYHAWSSGYPDFSNGNETCAALFEHLQWHDRNCDWKSAFICYTVTEQNLKQYVYIPTIETWSYAQKYCRTHYTDLAKIENEQENRQARETEKNLKIAWIGLYRVPWAWSDMSSTPFRNQDSLTVNNYLGNQHCICTSPSHEWADEDCNKEKAFICQQVVRMITTVKITSVTDADLTNPAINIKVLQQLGDIFIRKGWTDSKLQWKILTKRREKI